MPAEPRDVARRLVGELEVRQHLPRPILEQPDGVRGDDLTRVVGSFLGHPQGRNDTARLNGQAEGLPARHQQVQLRTGRDRRFHEPLHAVEDVLAVVDDQQQVGVTERGDRSLDLVADPLATRPVGLERGRHGRGDVVGIGHRGEIDEPASAAELGGAGQADLDREAGLARATRSDQRHEAMLAHRSPNVGQQIVAADEARERRDQIADDGDPGGGGDGAAGRQRRRLRDDRGFEPLQLRTGIEALLLGEELPHVLIDGQRVALAARSIEREHELAPEALSERVLLRELLDLTENLAMEACVEIGLDPILERIEAQALEPRRLRQRPPLAFEAEQRRSPPEGERVVQRRSRVGGGATRELVPAEPGETFEVQRVDAIRRHVEPVAHLIADHGVAPDRRSKP